MLEKVNRMNELYDTYQELLTTKQKVYFEIGPSPNLYSFGNSTFLNEMIEIIGAENIFKDESPGLF